MKTLRETNIGATVKVVKLHGEGAVKRRIMDIGITKNVEIYVRKVALIIIKHIKRKKQENLPAPAGARIVRCAANAIDATDLSFTPKITKEAFVERLFLILPTQIDKCSFLCYNQSVVP